MYIKTGLRSLYAPPYVHVPNECLCGAVSWYSRHMKRYMEPCEVRCSACGDLERIDTPPRVLLEWAKTNANAKQPRPKAKLKTKRKKKNKGKKRKK